MAKHNQIPGAQVPAVKLVIFGQQRRSMMLKGIMIFATAIMIFPSCRSHKLCEAYSSIQSEKKIKTGSAFSFYTIQSGHTVKL